jgi:hypothetical protein
VRRVAGISALFSFAPHPEALHYPPAKNSRILDAAILFLSGISQVRSTDIPDFIGVQGQTQIPSLHCSWENETVNFGHSHRLYLFINL